MWNGWSFHHNNSNLTENRLVIQYYDVLIRPWPRCTIFCKIPYVHQIQVFIPNFADFVRGWENEPTSIYTLYINLYTDREKLLSLSLSLHFNIIWLFFVSRDQFKPITPRDPGMPAERSRYLGNQNSKHQDLGISRFEKKIFKRKIGQFWTLPKSEESLKALGILTAHKP